MHKRSRLAVIAAALALPALVLSACSNPGGGETDASGGDDAATGGTLRLAGNSDVLYLDPAASYSAPDYQIHRALTRTLFAHVPTGNDTGNTEIVPDLALEIPTEDNGGISEDGTVYTVELQEGVEFDAPDGAREVVAEDVVLAAKRICNPVSPSNALSYFTDTIVGLAEYCEGFAEVEPTVEAIRAYIEGNDVEGVRAVDERTVEFTITQPAADFIDIMALGVFLAPQPVEYLEYLPDSPELRQNIISTGPYRIAEYVPEESFTLERNPVWNAELDPIRDANVDAIEISMGQDAAAVQQQLEAGTVDMQWADTVTPTASVPALIGANDERLVIGSDGAIRPYVVINTLSPNADGAYGNTTVRQALNFAIDRAASQQILGGPGLAEVATQILPPEVLGTEQANVLDVPAEGDTARAQELLEEAGYADGVPVKLLYRETEPYASLATAMQQDLEAAGFQVEMKVTTQNAFYSEFLLNQDITEAGEWDIALAAWSADYFGGRPYLVPMLDGRGYEAGSPNFGGWNNEEFNTLVDEALAAETPEQANELWIEADAVATEDAAWVPIAFARTPVFHSERVGGFEWNAWTNNGDMTKVFLDE
ncbi:ABC transporter substrate-binding protein [Microbacterium sp. ET2]|uniref:ABC transporter substrate-binding protein n=1 Tax=Microbacterium albipurpureum TaxID=3050384 RepID=UPI00259D0061|nr:ABC transporter substrate-binding protein [Microbacterium sp. ET2 (Ac-2212)]WJL96357.1 ABC transporter substrate-binding protein [Microbacterium sp. ET2 (Ac-2212)]